MTHKQALDLILTTAGVLLHGSPLRLCQTRGHVAQQRMQVLCVAVLEGAVVVGGKLRALKGRVVDPAPLQPIEVPDAVCVLLPAYLLPTHPFAELCDDKLLRLFNVQARTWQHVRACAYVRVRVCLSVCLCL